MAAKHYAIYCRVSKDEQRTKAQLPELKQWAEQQSHPVVWYEDKFSGKTMQRPGWERLEAAVAAGKVIGITIWKLDRLGRTASGLTKLFDELRERRVNLISLTDHLDLKTASGRLMANMLASVAQFETEVRAERVCAGIAAAKAEGKRWGGSKPGRRTKVTPETARAIRRMFEVDGTNITSIAKTLKLSRPTIYSVLYDPCQKS